MRNTDSPGGSVVPVAVPVLRGSPDSVVAEVPDESEDPSWSRPKAERIGRRASSTTSLIAARCSGVKASPGGSPSVDIAVTGGAISRSELTWEDGSRSEDER